MVRPSTNRSNGRGAGGRFARGNKGGPGNPHAARVGKWRSALAEAVGEDDIHGVIRVLVTKAKAGEPWAVRELLDRTLGKAQPPEPVEGEPLEIMVTYVNREDDTGRDALSGSRSVG